jgi:ABC-type branched-subunit amino acid transport system ATPase component
MVTKVYTISDWEKDNMSHTETKNKKEVVLSVKNLAKYFGGVTALTDFELDVQKGAIHCLIGPNGAGKTTVFKIIMGIYPPSSGKVILNGKDITGMKSHLVARNRLAIKMQVPGVYPELTLYDNMRIAAQKHIPTKGLKNEIKDLLTMVKLDDLGNPYVKNMSDGQQQWLEIAMALSGKPDILLLDEPAAGLGPEETEFTAQLVQELNAKGMTILFIEHDMNFVRRIAKQVTVLHQGRKFAEGSLEDILINPEVVEIYLGKEVKK